MDESLPLVLTPQPAAPTAGSATTIVTAGKPTKGVLILAIYLPE
ncbi:MAG: hypothetical protein QOH84_66 [Kribbellaceae bacterium]|jgi:hypothetical protein|nr:hypothetical protein [Kribbellaceae bacterium]